MFIFQSEVCKTMLLRNYGMQAEVHPYNIKLTPAMFTVPVGFSILVAPVDYKHQVF